MKIVLDCLLTLQTHFTLNAGRNKGSYANSRRKPSGERLGSADVSPREEPFRVLSSPPFGEDKRKLTFDSKLQRALRSPIKTGCCSFCFLLSPLCLSLYVCSNMKRMIYIFINLLNFFNQISFTQRSKCVLHV